MDDHFGGPSVNCGQILQKNPGKGQSPPPFWQCQDFGCICTSNPPLITEQNNNVWLQKVQTQKSMKFWTGRYWLFYVWSILSQNIAAAAWFPIEMHLPRIPLRLRNKLSDRFSDHTPVLQRIQRQTKAMTIEDSDKWWKSIPFYTWHRGPPWSQCSYIDTIWH